MKAGNTSSSLVSIPNLFYTRNLIEVQAFKDFNDGQYFCTKSLCKKFKDINVSGNPRNDSKKFELYNKTKFKPNNFISPITYDFKSIDAEISNQLKSQNLNLKKFHERINENKLETYSNDEMKREFANKIVGLLGTINNGDPKVNIVTPIVKYETSSTFRQAPVALTSSYDFNQIKSTATINFNGYQNDSSLKIFETTVNSKSKKLTKIKEKDIYLLKKKIYENKTIPDVHQSEHKSKTLDIPFSLATEKKKTLTPLVFNNDFQKNDNMTIDKNEKQQITIESKKMTTGSTTGRNFKENLMKGNFFDTSKYKSWNYNIFSERYDSDYVEREYKNKVYFE